MRLHSCTTRELATAASHLLHPQLPGLSGHQVHLGADPGDLLPEGAHLGPGVAHPREDIGEQAVQQRDVVRHQLGHHGLTHTLDQDLGMGQVVL